MEKADLDALCGILSRMDWKEWLLVRAVVSGAFQDAHDAFIDAHMDEYGAHGKGPEHFECRLSGLLPGSGAPVTG